MRVARFLLLSALFAFVASACSSQTQPIANVASSSGSIGIGEQRILLAVIDPETTAFLADPGSEATATLRDEDGTPLGTYDLEFVPTVPGVRGIYAGYFDIPAAGVYQLSIKQEGYDETAPTGFVAVDNPPMVGPGDPAPESDTRTSADVAELSLITSDPEPDPALYQLSVAEAVSNDRPTVVIFATPAFCATQTCGPMLSQVKDLRFDYEGIDFVHVEIYDDLQVEDTQDLLVVDAVVEWGLPSEPWTFVVGADGVVIAAFEGALNDDELTPILDRLNG